MSRRWRGALLVTSTGLLIAMVGVGVGLLWGMLMWSLLLLSEGERANLHVRPLRPEELQAHDIDPAVRAQVQVLEASGPLLFTAVPRIDGLLADRPPWPSALLLDLRRVHYIDGSALSALTHLIDCLAVRGGGFALVCQPHSPLLAQMRRSGLAARSLGETCCFTMAHALERLAAHHPCPRETRPGGKKRALGSLRLLRVPADHAR